MKLRHTAWSMLIALVLVACGQRSESESQRSLLVYDFSAHERPAEGQMVFASPACRIRSDGLIAEFEALCRSHDQKEPFPIPSMPWVVAVSDRPQSGPLQALLVHSEGTVGWVYDDVSLTESGGLVINGEASGLVGVSAFSESLFNQMKDKAPKEAIAPYESAHDEDPFGDTF